MDLNLIPFVRVEMKACPAWSCSQPLSTSLNLPALINFPAAAWLPPPLPSFTHKPREQHWHTRATAMAGYSDQHHLREALLQDDALALAGSLAVQQQGGQLQLPARPSGLTLLHASALLNAPHCLAVLAAAASQLDAGLTHSCAEVAEELVAWPLVAEGRLQLGEREQQVLPTGWRPLDLAVGLGQTAAAAALLDVAAAAQLPLTLAVPLENPPPDLQRLLARRVTEGRLGLTDRKQLDRLDRHLRIAGPLPGAAAGAAGAPACAEPI